MSAEVANPATNMFTSLGTHITNFWTNYISEEKRQAITTIVDETLGNTRDTKDLTLGRRVIRFVKGSTGESTNQFHTKLQMCAVAFAVSYALMYLINIVHAVFMAAALASLGGLAAVSIARMSSSNPES